MVSTRRHPKVDAALFQALLYLFRAYPVCRDIGAGIVHIKWNRRCVFEVCRQTVTVCEQNRRVVVAEEFLGIIAGDFGCVR
jgi:hypothetical protein